MPRFVYQVRDSGGSAGTGVLNASNLDDASRILRDEGNVIVDLHEQAAESRPVRKSRIRTRGVKRTQLVFFANQLAVMVDTGVSLPDALDSIAERMSGGSLHQVLTDISDQVKGGTEFSAALARYPKIFGDLVVSLVKASESSGTLGKMLQRISAYLEEQHRLRRRVKGALVYPAAMLCFCILVVVGMLAFVLPRFEKIYASRSAVLPLPTRVLLGFSNGLVAHWPFVLVGLALAAVGVYLFVRRPQSKVALDKIRLEMPLFGKIFRGACLARSFRTLATMIASGVDMLESLEITSDVSGNVYYRRIWSGVSERLKEGASLSEELHRYEMIPDSISQMVAAGERTGRLDMVLDRIAAFCEEDLDVAVRTITSLVEPAMIVIMGLVVGGIALALLLPVFSISKVVAG